MFKTSRYLLTGLVLLGLTAFGGADEPAKDTKAPTGDEKARSVDLKAVKLAPATTIDFAGELGLDFASLKGLGARIDHARSGVDPICLVSAGLELSAAETVAGKTASLKGASLVAEGVKAAKMRGSSQELKALALLVRDEETAKELTSLAKKATKREADMKVEKKRGISGTLTVHNRTRHAIHVYVNAENRGHVRPGYRRDFSVGDGEFDTTILQGRAAGGYNWGPYNISGRFNNYSFSFTGG